MSTVKLLLNKMSQKDKMDIAIMPEAIWQFLDEGEVEDDDYDEDIKNEDCLNVKFEFDGGCIELYSVPQKFLKIIG